jgi:threonine/homoserine/homoserine lactone efflux protein
MPNRACTVACFASVVFWAGFGTVIGRLLHNPRARRVFNRSMAGLLVLSLVPVFLQQSG